MFREKIIKTTDLLSAFVVLLNITIISSSQLP